MKIHDCHKEEKGSESLMSNSTQSCETQSSALSPHYFEEICTELLSEGRSVRFEAPGKSMYPAILDGETLIVEPVAPSAVKVGDIILYKSEEKLIAHRVISIEKVHSRNTQPTALSLQHPNTQSSILSAQSSITGSSALSTQYSFILRGDASYSYDEPVYADQVLGKVVAIDRNVSSIDPYSLKHRLSCWAHIWISRIKRFFS